MNLTETLMIHTSLASPSYQNASLASKDAQLKETAQHYQQPGRLVTIFGYLSRVYTIAIIIFGIIGNILSIVVLSKSPRLRKLRICPYMIALAFSDTGFLSTLSLILLESFGITWPTIPYMCKIAYYIWYSTTFLSGWYILTMAIERFILVYKPFLSLQFQYRSSAIASIGVTLVALMINIWVLFVFRQDTYRLSNGQTGIECDIDDKYADLFILMELLDTLFSFSIPLFGIFVLNILIIFKLYYAARQRGKMSTGTLSCSDNIGGGGSYRFSTGLRDKDKQTDRDRRVLLTKLSRWSTRCQLSERSGKGGDVVGSGQNGENGENSFLLSPVKCVFNKKRKLLFDREFHSEIIPGASDGSSIWSSPKRKLKTGNSTGEDKSSRTSANSSERRTTVILTSISLAYSLLNLPSYVMRLISFIPSNDFEFIIQHSAQMLFYTQFSVNFLLYSFHWIQDYRQLKVLKFSRTPTSNIAGPHNNSYHESKVKFGGRSFETSPKRRIQRNVHTTSSSRVPIGHHQRSQQGRHGQNQPPPRTPPITPSTAHSTDGASKGAIKSLYRSKSQDVPKNQASTEDRNYAIVL